MKGVDRAFNFNETGAVNAKIFSMSDSDNPTWYFNNAAYTLRGGNEIIKQNLTTGEEEIIYTDSETIDTMYLEPEMAYLRKGTTIYRLHIPTQQIEKVFSDPVLEDFYPISNNKIRVDLTNPEYTHYLEETGATENEVGIKEMIKYIVDLSTGEKTETLGYRGIETKNITISAVSTGSYGSGTYFTKNGSACNATNGLKCHSTSYCTWDPNNANASKCNCKIYGSAIQCMGYAKYVYAQNYGGNSWGSAKSFSYKNVTAADRAKAEADLKIFVTGLKNSAHLRIGGHSVIVTGTTTNGFNVIQANYDAVSCKVTTGSYTYSGLVSGGKTISANQ